MSQHILLRVAVGCAVGRHEWDVSRIWFNRVTHVEESCLSIYSCRSRSRWLWACRPASRTRCITHTNKSCHTYELAMSQNWQEFIYSCKLRSRMTLSLQSGVTNIPPRPFDRKSLSCVHTQTHTHTHTHTRPHTHTHTHTHIRTHSHAHIYERTQT